MRSHLRPSQSFHAAFHLGAAVLCTGLLMLLPELAPAAPAGKARSAGHRVSARQQCRLKTRKASSKPAPGAHRTRPRIACAHARPLSRSDSANQLRGPAGPGALEATPFNLAAGEGSAGEPAGAARQSESGSHVPPGGGAAGGGSGAGAGGGGGRQGKFGGNLPVETGETVNDPIDPRFLTDVPFGMRSFWIQPWRAYLDTWPAARLLDSLGINFNVSAANADATAQLLQDTGFKLARVGITWAALSYSDPTSFLPDHLASITARLTALHAHGLRPLIVLQAYSGAPTPEKHVVLETVSPAPAGARTVTLTPASAAAVVPGKTGFNELPAAFRGSPNVLITSVGPDGVAALARPLLSALAAGPHGGTTLLYAPFGPPRLANGQPNPEFQATLAGWLNYVGAVCKEAASILGADGFDLEIWNELTFGSAFLNSGHYYSPAEGPAEASAAPKTQASAEASAHPEAEGEAEATPGSGPEETGPEAGYDSEAGFGAEAENTPEVEEGPEDEGAVAEEPEGTPQAASAHAATTGAPESAKSHKHKVGKEIHKALLNETVAYVRNPANGISPGVGITNGFASETPFPSGAAAPLGLTALSKHPYVGARNFPADNRVGHVFPLDALGARDTPAKGNFTPLFVPEYQSLLPEYTLTATSTETSIRDLAPFTSYIYHFPHGRDVGPPGGSPVQKWITEYNLIPGKAKVVGPDEVTPQTGASATLSQADKRHFDAKVVLRSLVSMVNKGMSREYFFAAAPGAFSLIDSGFFSALEANPGSYPGDGLGGETMDSLRSMLARFAGPGPAGDARALTLLSIAQEGNHAQFKGDGTAAHPDLYDRDVLAVLPFQSSPTHFVIPVYVMTRDLLTLYDPSAPASEITRFDLPNETFRITLGGLPETSAPPTVSAYDPIHKQSTPASLIARDHETATFEISATDYPRLLSLEYTGS